MTLDVISQHGLLIGLISVVIHLPEVIEEIPEIKDIIEASNLNTGRNLQHLLVALDSFLIIFSAIVAGIIMIIGILKRYQWLLVPWLLVEIFYTFGVAETFGRNITEFQFYAYFIGLQPLLFFPICYLFFDIRRKNAAAAAKLKN